MAAVVLTILAAATAYIAFGTSLINRGTAVRQGGTDQGASQQPAISPSGSGPSAVSSQSASAPASAGSTPTPSDPVEGAEEFLDAYFNVPPGQQAGERMWSMTGPEFQASHSLTDFSWWDDVRVDGPYFTPGAEPIVDAAGDVQVQFAVRFRKGNQSWGKYFRDVPLPSVVDGEFKIRSTVSLRSLCPLDSLGLQGCAANIAVDHPLSQPFSTPTPS